MVVVGGEDEGEGEGGRWWWKGRGDDVTWLDSGCRLGNVGRGLNTRPFVTDDDLVFDDLIA